jgi:hypothetical protein
MILPRAVINAIRLKQIPTRIVKMIDDEFVIVIVVFNEIADNVDIFLLYLIFYIYCNSIQEKKKEQKNVLLKCCLLKKINDLLNKNPTLRMASVLFLKTYGNKN